MGMYVCQECGKKYDLPYHCGTISNAPCELCNNLNGWQEPLRCGFLYYTTEIHRMQTAEALAADLIDWIQFSFRRKASRYMRTS